MPGYLLALHHSWAHPESTVMMEKILAIPSRIERRALLEALPSLAPMPGWAVPAWTAPGSAGGALLVLECGMGPERSEALAPELDRASPAALWLAGWCGGLRGDLRVGDLVLADAALSETPEGLVRIGHPPPPALVAWLQAWAASHARRLVVAPVLTSSRVLVRAAEKRAAAATGAAAVEMEAAPLARWAAEHGVPFTHLRVVLDPAGSDLPPEDLHGEDEADGEMSRYLRRALWYPRTWLAVWRLLGHSRRAQQVMAALGTALTALGGPLGTGG